MPSLVSQLIVQLIDQASDPALKVGKSIAGISDAARKAAQSSSEIDRTTAAVRKLHEQAKALDGMQLGLRQLSDARTSFRSAQADVERLARELRDARDAAERFAGVSGRGKSEIAQQAASAREAVRRLEQQYVSAQSAVRSASAAFLAQRDAVVAAKHALEQAGLPARGLAEQQARIRQQVDAATDAMRRQQAVAQQAAQQQKQAPTATVQPGSNLTDAAATAAGAVGAGGLGRTVYDRSREQLVEFDIESRRQRAVLGLTPEEQAAFREQALRLGQETRYSNADFIRGQMTIAQGLPKHLQQGDNGGVVRALVEETRFLAEALDKTKEPVSVDMAAELMRARLNAGNYDMSSPEAARASARRAANELVELSKISGMNYEDLRGYTKFGEATGRTAGMSQEFMDAAVAQLRRVGFEGSMGGNFIRALGMRLSAPNRNTLDALNAAGLRYQDYQRAGTDFSTSGFADTVRRRFGRDVTGDTLSRIEQVFQDESATQDQSRFIEQVTQALIDGGFAKRNKQGEVNAQDRERIAKAAENFYRMNIEGVDIQRLLTDLLFSGKITPALARFLGGQEHGGRLLNLKPGDMQQDMRTMANVPNDRAQQISRETMGGVGGAYLQMKGSIETLFLRIGESFEKPLTAAFKGIDQFAQALAGLPDKVIAFGTAATVATAALVTAKGTALLLGRGAGLAGAAAGAGGVAATVGGAASMSRVPTFVKGVGIVGGLMFAKEVVDAGAETAGQIAAGATRDPFQIKKIEDAKAEMADLTDQIGRLDERMQQIRSRSKDETAMGALLAPLESERSILEGQRRRLEEGLAAMEARAQQAGQTMKESLSVEATPTVNTSSIDAATEKARQLRRELEGAGAAASRVSSDVRGLHADIGVGE